MNNKIANKTTLISNEIANKTTLISNETANETTLINNEYSKIPFVVYFFKRKPLKNNIL